MRKLTKLLKWLNESNVVQCELCWRSAYSFVTPYRCFKHRTEKHKHVDGCLAYCSNYIKEKRNENI